MRYLRLMGLLRLAPATSAVAQRRHQFHHWGRAREIPDLLYINSRVVVALVHVGIGIALQIGEAQPGAVRRTPHLFGFVECPSQRPVNLPRPFDGFHQLGTRAAHHQADSILAIAARMSAEFAEHAVSLSAASSAAEEDFEYLTLQQPHLGRVATRRPSNPNLGLRDHGAIFSSAPPLRARSLAAVHHWSLSGSCSMTSASHVALSISAGISIT